MLKLRCRHCNSLIELQEDRCMSTCDCGKCSLQLNDGKVLVGSENGIGGYVMIKDNTEYVMVSREELN